MARPGVSKRKTRKQRNRLRQYSIGLIVLVLVVWAILAAVSHSKLGAIEGFTFSNHEYLDEAILEARTLDIVDRRPLLVRRDRTWTLQRNAVRSALMSEYNEIRSIRFNRSDKILDLEITLFEPHGLGCVGGVSPCWFMSYDGIIYQASPEFSLGVYPVIALAEEPEQLPATVARDLVDVYRDIFVDDMYTSMFEVDVLRDRRLDVQLDLSSFLGEPVNGYLLLDRKMMVDGTAFQYLKDRFVALHDKTDMVERLQEDPEKFEYLDLRFDDKMYVKFTE